MLTAPPSILLDPLSLSVEEGDRASLMCQFQAMAHPVTSVVWKKNGKLTLTLPSFPDFHFISNVAEKLKFSPRPINKKLELGNPAKVYCKAQGARPPVIKWFKEGQHGEQMFEISDNVKDINGTLHFANVSAEDKGRYVFTPKFKVYPLNPTEAYEGNLVMIHCVAEGDPKPTIKWDRNSNFSGFDRNRFHVLENGTLLVEEVHMADGGKYGCTAGNSGGFKREEVTLIVRSREGYQPNEDPEGDGSMMTKTFTITLSIAGSYMMLVIGLMIWCRHRRRRRKQAYLNANGAEGTDTLLTKAENGEAVGEHTELKETAHREGAGDGADTAQSHSSTQSKRSNKSSNYDRLAFPRQDLHNLVLLGRGEFGEVFLAKAAGLNEGEDKEKETVVMVKSLQNTRDDSALHEFKRELDMFHKLQHDHVARLVGLCREMDPHYMILEYSDWGDLKQFLLATRGGSGKDEKASRNAGKSPPRPPQLSVTQIIQLASQIAEGMEHLSNQRFVHRDLAARNCLIASNLTVKVIPLRWMPYEAVYEDDYSTKSDIYSFACLVWEMFYQGELPFSKMSDDAVLAALKKHELQWKPHKAAPQSLQNLLVSCWSDSPRDRPTFSQLTVTIGEISIDSAI
ncbi:Tyrosine-protein kinase-like otk [Blattella germanica]|nr:Tyrosine-protein kinase-like otk [Blattella germanica]